ncbi:MAG TPA: hypothetical protein VNG90_00360 [Candidatus Acidoferrum sp.]|nr:hypothetical protein [Candidatus Acidoferrum sp.]
MVTQSGQLSDSPKLRQILGAELWDHLGYEGDDAINFLLFLLNQKRKPKATERVIRALLNLPQSYSFDEHLRVSMDTSELLAKVFPGTSFWEATPAMARELSTNKGQRLRQELANMKSPTPRAVLETIFDVYDIDPGDIGKVALELLGTSYGKQEGFARSLSKLLEKNGPAPAATFALLRLSQEVDHERVEVEAGIKKELNGDGASEQASAPWLEELQAVRDKSGLTLKEVAAQVDTSYSVVQLLFRGQLPKNMVIFEKIINLLFHDQAQTFLERYGIQLAA